MTSAVQQAPEVNQEREIMSGGEHPGWVIDELPGQYAELASQIAALKQQARAYEDVAAVLWRTGPELTRAVAALFSALQLETELTAEGTSHDITVHLGNERRLLVHVVGSSEALTRKSPHIARLLRSVQEDSGENDRVVLVANIYFDMPVAARRGEWVMPDALRLIGGLGANFLATSTLFGIWKYSLKDAASAKKSLLNIHAQDGGILR